MTPKKTDNYESSRNKKKKAYNYRGYCFEVKENHRKDKFLNGIIRDVESEVPEHIILGCKKTFFTWDFAYEYITKFIDKTLEN